MSDTRIGKMKKNPVIPKMCRYLKKNSKITINVRNDTVLSLKYSKILLSTT